MTHAKIILPLIMLSLMISACAPMQLNAPAQPTPSLESVVLGRSVILEPAEVNALPAEGSALPNEPALVEPERTPTAIPSSTAPTAPTAMPTATSTPAYVDKLRGKVIIDQAVCHYGPGAPYLYKYGVYRDSNLELLRRVEGGNYIEIQAIGGNNPCWVRADYFEIQGNWLDLQPVRFDEVNLPISPYYAPAGGVSARRDGDQVTVFWNGLQLRAGDDSEQTPYIVEAWVCQGGQNVFVAAGSRTGAVTIQDEAGCAEASYGYHIAAEKHGYTWRVAVPWPVIEPEGAR